jgi:hypothetical protein
MDLSLSATVLQDRSELFMKRHIATALLVGMGIAVERPQFAAQESRQSDTTNRRINRGTVCRMSEFGHLKSAGRVRRAQIAKLFVDEGMLFAEWSGQVTAPEPRRIETEELDAEWMAHVAAEKWFLARRELVPTDGKVWSIQVYGDAADAGSLRIVATSVEAGLNGGRVVFTANYMQSKEAARLSIRGNRDGRIMRAWSASAPTLADLRERHPIIFATHLEPALEKMVG